MDIEKLSYLNYENLAIETPDIKTLTEKINELIDVVNEIKALTTP